MEKEKKLKINGKDVILSKPGKLLFPEMGISKEDILNYYRRIWPFAKHFAAGRPMVLQRFPDGIGEEGFFQKKALDYYPEWIETINVWVKEKDSTNQYVNCKNEETIAYLANQGVITFHTWLSRQGELDKPDRMVFDFDPPDNDFDKVRKASLKLKSFLDDKSLPSYPMITGSRGLHVIIPLKARHEYDEVRNTAREIAEQLAESDSEHLTTETARDRRRERVFIDYLRNSYGQTSVMPYSLRALKGAPVAVPVDWQEVSKAGLNPGKYNIQNIFRRLSHKENPWDNIGREAVSLEDFR